MFLSRLAGWRLLEIPVARRQLPLPAWARLVGKERKTLKDACAQEISQIKINGQPR
jgi:hypothetical protein